MTDLVRQLRDSKGWPTLGNAAADRIEELEAECWRMQEERDRAIWWRDSDQARAEAAEAINAELLEALENLLKVHEGEGGTKYHAGDIARAAIAKAKGKS